MTPEEKYAKLKKAFLGKRGVTIEGKGFGSGALRVGGSIFAMLSSKREFVVKLPRRRVDELTESGVGHQFDPGHGRLMKEWLALARHASTDWVALATEAKAYVGSKKATKRRPPPRAGEGNR
jgi:hypothetical protein